MSTASITYPATANTPRIFAKETKYEFLKLLRTRSFSIATIGFPVMFYLLFGVANKHLVAGDIHIAKYMMAGYACFGLIGAALFGIGVGMAAEINAGWLEVKRSSPMPPAAYLFAKCMTAIAFGLIITTVLIILGVTLGGVSITAMEVARMLALAVPGSIVFASMGLFLAQVIPANAAPGIVNIIYLPMSFLGGLWIPLSQLPHWVRSIASVMPTYHLAQLMLGIFGRGYRFDDVSTPTHWFGLIGFACLMLGSAWAVFSRRQQEA
jgi:ABC-2 type transport system permease protein